MSRLLINPKLFQTWKIAMKKTKKTRVYLKFEKTQIGQIFDFVKSVLGYDNSKTTSLRFRTHCQSHSKLVLRWAICFCEMQNMHKTIYLINHLV